MVNVLLFLFRYRYDHYDSRKNRDYTSEDDIQLLKNIKRKSKLDWRILLANFRYEQYIWRFYPNLKGNPKLNTISNQLELETKTNSIPENVVFIVGLVNAITCFNGRLRYYLYILHWNQRLFMYYNRYYRYLGNEKKFGKRITLKRKHNHKLHFVACIYHRQLKGIRLEKNHLCY